MAKPDSTLSTPVYNSIITYNGEAKTLVEWSAITGIKHVTLWARVKAGWSAERTIETPVNTAFRAKKKREQHGLHSQFKAEWNVWSNMKNRCENPKNNSYYKYGERGIYVCERWSNSFAAFIEDMGPRPSSLHSIEREDNNGPYAPENCIWALPKTQARNKRTSRILELNGESLTLAEWVERTGIHHTTILRRIDKLGWSIPCALTTPVRAHKEYDRN